MTQIREPRRGDKRIPRARYLRRAMTDAERKLWWRLRELPLATSHFRRQATIGPHFVDFACHRSKLIVEVDGGQHKTSAGKTADAKQTAFLIANGYRVLRFWNNDVLKDIDAVMMVVYAAVNEAPPTPYPSPPLRGGRGTASAEHRTPHIVSNAESNDGP